VIEEVEEVGFERQPRLFTNRVKLRRADDYAVSLHLTPGAFKINEEIFAAARKYNGARLRFYISPLAIIPGSLQHCVGALAHRIEFSRTCGKSMSGG
jgi:hypothetical protein